MILVSTEMYLHRECHAWVEEQICPAGQPFLKIADISTRRNSRPAVVFEKIVLKMLCWVFEYTLYIQYISENV